MVDSSFNLKPNGEVWRNLIYDEWWTNESGTTGEDGIYNVRAFKGDHRVAVRVGDAEYNCSIKLQEDGTVVRVVLDENGNLTEPGTHVHQFETEWKSDTASHWHVCSCGEKADVEAHTAGEWIVDKEASAEEDGSKHKECIVCGTVMENETILKTGTAVKPEADSDGNKGSIGNGNDSNKGNVNTKANVDTKVNGKNTATGIVKTGDTRNMKLWLMLTAVSGVVLAGGALAVKQRRKKKR